MKRRKNIVKKIELTKKFKLSYKKEFKHYLKEPRLKFKFFYKILFFMKSFYRINNLYKFFKYNSLNINNGLLIKRYSYFNYITNGLDLKYNNIQQDVFNLNFLNSFNNKKLIFLNNYDGDIIKFQKFITIIDNNCIFADVNTCVLSDLFESSIFIYYSLLLSTYQLSYNLVLIYKCF